MNVLLRAKVIWFVALIVMTSAMDLLLRTQSFPLLPFAAIWLNVLSDSYHSVVETYAKEEDDRKIDQEFEELLKKEGMA